MTDSDGGERHNKHRVVSSHSVLARPRRVLKDDDAFAVYDAFGDMRADEEGLYFKDTRFLSLYELRIGPGRPLLLASDVKDDNTALSVDVSNPTLRAGLDAPRFSQGLVYASRKCLLGDAVALDRLLIRNFGRAPVRFELALGFDADFHDVFEVRGEKRSKRGQKQAEVTPDGRVQYLYVGLDGIQRRTTLAFTPRPDRLEVGRAVWSMELPAKRGARLITSISCGTGEAVADRRDPAARYRQVARTRRADARLTGRVSSSNVDFERVMRRSIYDLAMLNTRTPHGPYPYAGVPWFSTVFGRDGLITAMLVLWRRPDVARAVLEVLAEYQAREHDRHDAADPGKILHELRRGEMARTGEVPFRRYYGAVDTTPLFIMLAGMYFDRTADLATVRRLWPNVCAALDWIDRYGDADGDGLVEYSGDPEEGLTNQGWKDSGDSIFHEDGTLARGPIAVCEVQGYVVAAKRYAARLARAVGESEHAERLEAGAEATRSRIEEAFWVEDLGAYAIALDGEKRACRVLSSNPGHLLFSGAVCAERAARTVDLLMGESSFTGWGMRTIALGQARYNPISYHNGSVWPHDNAIIGQGFARYGFKTQTARLLNGLFQAAKRQEVSRLPELFAGFRRQPGRGPTAYPTACAPQAWASAAPLGLLASCLGLEIDAAENCVRLSAPMLPDSVADVILHDLEVNDSLLTLRCERWKEGVRTEVLARSGDARLVL